MRIHSGGGPRRLAVAAVLCAAVFLPAPRAQACATCLCGDPTITTMGTERPFAGRLRAGVEYLSRGETFGEPGVSAQSVDERRLTYSAAYATSARWMFSAALPWVDKEVTRFNLSRERASGLGDLDLAARWFAPAGEGVATGLWGLSTGLRLPTSSEQKAAGAVVDFDAQPGAGATLYSLGAWGAHYAMPWMGYASAAFQRAATDGYQGYRSGDAVFATVRGQYGAGYRVALQLGVDGRWRDKDRYRGVADPDSGGVLVMLTPGLAWTPVTDLVLNVSWQYPAIEDPNGHQDEDPTLRIGVTYDF